MSEKSIYVCYPFADDPVGRSIKVRFLARELNRRGFLPLAVHLYWPQVLYSGVPNKEVEDPNRKLVLSYCKRMVGWCDELWAFGDKLNDNGMPTLISSGMAMEIEKAKALGIPVVGKDITKFIPSVIVENTIDQYTNLGMDISMSSIRNMEGGWNIRVATSSNDFYQNVFTLAHGAMLLLKTTVNENRLDQATNALIEEIKRVSGIQLIDQAKGLN